MNIEYNIKALDKLFNKKYINFPKTEKSHPESK
jgi:hypothetical protein